MLYIVLPPELSKRSIQILIQYMYSGEATVSNDILNEVLRGGELLKIRGLWRNNNNNQTNDSNASSTPSAFTPTTTATTTTTSLSSLSTTATTATSSVHPPKLNDSTKDGLGVSGGERFSVFEHRLPTANSTPVIKESPVIITSQQNFSAAQQIALSSLLSLPPPPPSQSMHQTIPPQHMVQLPPPQPPQQQQQHQNVLVKRENIHEQSDDNSAAAAAATPLHYGLVSLQIAAAAVKKAQLPPPPPPSSTTNETRIKSAASTNGGNDTQLRRYSIEHMKDDSSAEPRVASKENEITMRLGDKRRVSNAEQQRSGHHLEPGEKSACYSGSSVGGKLIMDKKAVDVQIPEALSFLTIKQEPIEWNDYDAENGIEKSHIEVTVKPEIIYTNEESENEGMKFNF